MFGKSLTTLLVAYNNIVRGTTSRTTRIPLAYPKQFNRGLHAQAFGRARPAIWVAISTATHYKAL